MNDENKNRQMLEMPPVSKKRAQENKRNIQKKSMAQQGGDLNTPPTAKTTVNKKKPKKKKQAAVEKKAALARKTAPGSALQKKSTDKGSNSEPAKKGGRYKKSAVSQQRSLSSVGHPDDMYLNEKTYISNIKPIDIQSKVIKDKSKVHKADKPQKKRRKSLASYSLYIIMFTVLIAAALFILSKTVLFNMEKIVVEGDTVYSYDDVVAKCGVEVGTNLFSLNMNEVSERLIKELPYIDKADVGWGFPTTLNITLNQATVLANVERNGIYYLISENGRIMDAGLKAPDKKYPVVLGFDPDYAVSGDFLSVADDGNRNLVCKLLSAVKKYDGLSDSGEKTAYDKKEILFSVFESLGEVKINDKIKIVDISNIYGIKLNYDNRIVLEMGEFTEFALKLRIADNLICKGEFDGEKGSLILSSVSSSSDSMKVTFSPDHTDDTVSADYPSDDKTSSAADADSSQDESADDDEEPTYDDEEPTYDDEEPAYDDEEPTYDDEEPTYDNEEPEYDDEEPTYDDEESADDDEEPTYDDDEIE